MGSNTSNSNFPLKYDVDRKHFSLTFTSRDKIRLVLAPYELITSTRQILAKYWRVDYVRISDSLAEFKLEDYELKDVESENADSEFLLTRLIKSYYELGWEIEANMGMSLAGKTGNTIIFKKREPISTSVTCVSLDRTNRISVLGPDSMISLVRECISKEWPSGIKKESKYTNNICESHEFRLNAYPWFTLSNKDEYFASELICTIAKRLYDAGWVHCASVKTSDISACTLYFINAPYKVVSSRRMFGVSISECNFVRLFQPPSKVIDPIRNIINSELSRRAPHQQLKKDTIEFRLNTVDYYYESTDDEIRSKRALNRIVRYLVNTNFKLYSVCDVTLNDGKMSTFLFQEMGEYPENDKLTSIHSISLNEVDRIRLIGSFDEFSKALRSILKGSWPGGIQAESDLRGAHEFRLFGVPFKSSSLAADTVNYSMFIIFLFENMKRFHRFKFIGSANLDTSDYSEIGMNTLFFKYDEA